MMSRIYKPRMYSSYFQSEVNISSPKNSLNYSKSIINEDPPKSLETPVICIPHRTRQQEIHILIVSALHPNTPWSRTLCLGSGTTIIYLMSV
ncbi:hypothetical protein CY34DRAFT_799991 [Suillus luteus UH-Slu-Lm8-n1]|uniref:Uncharacterized protein n=1 Tax=Suillus luteus UH-Slu-Lm8-n1 TaxID=930992 RepID=A0A0D0BUY3_9AGAM|nr:hypothetical protein CY34DRAFT_799991 [Suillus luteus UH-Slu-Lm8-n1]